MNMEWLNHSAGFSGLGMRSTGSSHCRQYIVCFLRRDDSRSFQWVWYSSIPACFCSLKKGDEAAQGGKIWGGFVFVRTEIR